MATDEKEIHEPNSYFGAFAGIVAALDALAKAVTPDTSDDQEPAPDAVRPCCNLYFDSFKAICDALVRLKDATEERLVDLAEGDPKFKAWLEESYSLGIGKGANATSNGVAVGWNSSAGAGTGTGSRDSGAVAVGKAAQAWGIGAVALGKGANAGTTSARTTLPTVQLGTGSNAEDGTLQFRDWKLVGTDGKVPAERLPPDAGGIVEATGSLGTGDDRTTGLWYAVFTLEGLGIKDDAVCLSGMSLVCSNNATLPAGETRRLEIRSEDGAVLLAESENEAAFDTKAAVASFRFRMSALLNAGVKYRLKLVGSSGANESAPVMLASTAGVGGYLASYINGTSSLRTDFFPCVSFTLLKPAPDIAAAIAEMTSIPTAYGFCHPEMSEFERIEVRNRAVNCLALDGHSPYIVLPPAIDGKARDFILRVERGEDARLIMPADTTYESDGDGVFGEISSDATSVFFFFETKPGVFLVSRKDVDAISP